MVIGYLSACQILTCKPVLDMNKITQVSQLLCSRLVRGTIDNVRRFCIYFADKVQLDINLRTFICFHLFLQNGFPGGSVVKKKKKNPPAVQETRVQCLGEEDPPGEGNSNPLQ